MLAGSILCWRVQASGDFLPQLGVGDLRHQIESVGVRRLRRDQLGEGRLRVLDAALFERFGGRLGPFVLYRCLGQTLAGLFENDSAADTPAGGKASYGRERVLMLNSNIYPATELSRDDLPETKLHIVR